MNRPNIEFIAYIYVLLYFLSACKQRNSQREHGQPMEKARGLFCTCDSGVARCHSVSLLANELDVRSVFPGQVGLAAVNHICIIPEAIIGCKNLKIH